MLTEDDNTNPDLLRQISILVHMLNDGMEVRPTDPDSMHASTRAEADRIALRREMVMHLVKFDSNSGRYYSGWICPPYTGYTLSLIHI